MKNKILFSRIGIIGVGILGNQLIETIFDYVLYPFVVWKLGPLTGGILMTFLSAVTCYMLILFYDWAKRDWLGIESIKQYKQDALENSGSKIIRYITKQSNFFALILISIYFDPFVAVIYMRHGAHNYNGMKKRDWTIFWLSLCIANVFWIGVTFSGVEFIKILLHWITASLM